MFNRLNKPLSKEEMRTNPNPSLLTVGARAMQKHSSRKSINAKYWIEKEFLNGMTE